MEFFMTQEREEIDKVVEKLFPFDVYCEVVPDAEQVFCQTHDKMYALKQLNGEVLRKKIINVILTQVEKERERNKVTGETSDGYHTFNELYEHRVLLWINLCLLNLDKSYVIENHFEGWFLLGMETEHGQISYHCPNKHICLVSGISRREPVFDGHTSKDVIERLIKIAIRNKLNQQGK